MSVRKCFAIASLVLITSVAAPSKASADWLLTPFVGWNWGGTANLINGDDFDDEFEQKAMFGASLGMDGRGSHSASKWTSGSRRISLRTRAVQATSNSRDSNLTTVMGNLLIGVPIGGQHGVGFRPYAVGGVGIVKSDIGSSGDLFNVDSTDWGFNVGAGAMFFFSDNVGIRGDVRYFRSFEDVEPIDDFNIGFANFRFWRGTLGVTIRF